MGLPNIAVERIAFGKWLEANEGICAFIHEVDTISMPTFFP
jgi:hypothetical protein